MSGLHLKHCSMKNLVPPLGLMAIIFILSSIPGRPEDGGVKFLAEIDPQLQNLLHVPLFGTLQVLWLHALKNMAWLTEKSFQYAWPSAWLTVASTNCTRCSFPVDMPL